MFKMGCSMARKILGPGPASSSNEQMGACSAGAKASAGEKNGKQANKSADELGDFSKLEDDPRLPLNVRQIFKITKSWKAIARTMSKTGTAMFLNLFEQNQDLFHLFDRFQHLKGKELHESMELREHAATVMATLDQSINSLSDYDNFVSYLHSIGELHRKVPGFKRDYFWKIEQPFMKAVKQTLDERCNETIEQIYVIAIKLIIETIAEGYGQDADSAGGERDFEAGAGGGAANESPERGVEDEKEAGRDVGGKSGAGQKVCPQQQRTNSNENNRARQHANWAPNEALASGCPISRESPSERAQISEKKSISEQGRGPAVARADSSEQEASLVEATCELFRSTGDWLSQAGRAHEATRVQWERLINEMSADGSSPEAKEKGAAKCEHPHEGLAAPIVSSIGTDRLKPDGKWARPAADQTQATTACPRSPATQYKSSPARPAKHQIIIPSCPVHCGAPNEPRFDLAQRGVCQVQGSKGVSNGEENASSVGRLSCVVTGDFVNQPAANIRPQQREHTAMMSSCNNYNELVRWKLTGAPDGAHVTVQPEVPRERAESADLIKSARRRLGRLAKWCARPNGVPKLARLFAGRPNSGRSSPDSPKPTSNQNQSDTRRVLHCARQSPNNNKLQITPPPLPMAPNAAEVTLQAHSRLDKCKQGEWPAPRPRPLADERPPSREQPQAAPWKVGALLHKSESAVSKLLANARRDTQLAELIKVLLLINRLLFTLARRPQLQAPTSSSTTQASAPCPLSVAS